MSEKTSGRPVLRRSIEIPDGIVALLLARYMGGEKQPTVEFAVLDTNLLIQPSDTRRVGHEVVEAYHPQLLRFEQYFPGSGCMVEYDTRGEGQHKTHCITATEPGLESLVGRPMAIRTSDGDAFIFVGDAASSLDESQISRLKDFLISCRGQYCGC